MQQTLPPAAADAERHRQERSAFLYLPLLALAVTVVVELFNHKSFTDGPAGFWRFMTEEPLAFLVNFLIVLVTLCPAFFLRRRAFWCALVSFLWLICGGVNGFILLNRMTPFTVADLTVFETGLDTVPNYLSTGYIILLIAALVLVAAGLAAGAIRAFHEAGLWNHFQDVAFDLSNVLSTHSLTGTLLEGIFGYQETPSVSEVAMYFTYLVPALILFAMPPRTGSQTSRVAP